MLRLEQKSNSAPVCRIVHGKTARLVKCDHCLTGKHKHRSAESEAARESWLINLQENNADSLWLKEALVSYVFTQVEVPISMVERKEKKEGECWCPHSHLTAGRGLSG